MSSLPRIAQISRLSSALTSVLGIDMKKDEMLFRTIDLDRAHIDDDLRMIPASLSSEQPVSRSFGSEVLLHSEGS